MKVKKYKLISFIAICLFSTTFFCGYDSKNTANSSNSITQTNEKTMAAVVKDNELDILNLKNSNEILNVDNGGMFSHPVLSKDKNYIAYIKDKTLYVATIDGKKSKLNDNVPVDSYTWIDKNTLAYSPETGGIYVFDAPKLTNNPFIKNEFNYKNITAVTPEKLYAEKYRIYEKDGAKHVQDYGMVLLQPDNKEQIVVPSIPSDYNTNLGMYPIIAGTSADFRFIYIFEHPHAGSLATDGMSFSSYDTKLDKYTKYPMNDITLLGYKDNISSCPTNTELVALNNGADRLMNDNKSLGVLNLVNGTLETLTDSSQVTMTPTYSNDGKTISYAACEKTKAINKIGDFTNTTHPIYSINSETKKVTQLTNPKNAFDFAPIYINNNDILFFRSTSKDNVSMWKLENGVETQLTDGIIFYNSDKYHDQNFFGHFNVPNYVDVK